MYPVNSIGCMDNSIWNYIYLWHEYQSRLNNTVNDACLIMTGCGNIALIMGGPFDKFISRLTSLTIFVFILTKPSISIDWKQQNSKYLCYVSSGKIYNTTTRLSNCGWRYTSFISKLKSILRISSRHKSL